VALPILSSDALSSVAYGPEALLAVLALAGSAALGVSPRLSAAIVVLMIAVGLSYRQVIKAYPHGGGSYVVAGKNLGEVPALIAAAGLMTDYVLTVAVSIASGTAAVTSAIPQLTHAAVPLRLVAIALLVAVNLRGVRQAGAIFSAPTYAFLLGMCGLIAVGLFDAFTRGFAPAPSVGLEPIEGLGVLLVLRAFSSGATAMTGIEAISNAVPAFQPPAARNARVVLTLMVGVLVTMFAALVVLMHLDGIVPQSDQTALSQLAHRSFGSGPLYAYVQGATALVLLLAANTAFNGFPRLLSVMARNGHAPRQFLRLGDRLAFSNGIIALALAAATLFVVFEGRTSALIPVYAVGGVRRLRSLADRNGRALVAPARRPLAQEHPAQRRRGSAVGHRLRRRHGDEIQPGRLGGAPVDRAARAREPAHPRPLRRHPSGPGLASARACGAAPCSRARTGPRPGCRQHPRDAPLRG
jgi:amino acid transporter